MILLVPLGPCGSLVLVVQYCTARVVILRVWSSRYRPVILYGNIVNPFAPRTPTGCAYLYPVYPVLLPQEIVCCVAALTCIFRTHTYPLALFVEKGFENICVVSLLSASRDTAEQHLAGWLDTVVDGGWRGWYLAPGRQVGIQVCQSPWSTRQKINNQRARKLSGSTRVRQCLSGTYTFLSVLKCGDGPDPRACSTYSNCRSVFPLLLTFFDESVVVSATGGWCPGDHLDLRCGCMVQLFEPERLICPRSPLVRMFQAVLWFAGAYNPSPCRRSCRQCDGDPLATSSALVDAQGSKDIAMRPPADTYKLCAR